MQEISEGCQFSFDPDRWESEHETKCRLNDSELDEDGAWTCPRSATGDRTTCLFHTPPAERERSDSAVADALLATVRSGDHATSEGRKERKEFVGAAFGDLDLRHEMIASEDSYPIDLRHARVEGRLDLGRATVRDPLVLDGLVCEGTVDCSGTRFEAESTFDGARIGGDFRGRDARFLERFAASDAVVAGDGIFHDARFAGRAVFRSTTWNGPVEFAGVRFEEDALFDDNLFRDEAGFSNTKFGGEAFFSETRARTGLNLWNAAFEGRARFTAVAVRSEWMVDDAVFNDEARFDGVVLGADVRLRGAEFEDAAVFTDPNAPDGSVVIDLRDATVSEGTLAHTADSVSYDLSDATVGAVELEGERGELSLDRYQFVDTTFDGFDLRDSKVRRALVDREWTLAPSDATERDLDHSTLESTYLKAKHGARGIGDNEAAGEFFRREKIHRRRHHYEVCINGDLPVRERWRAAGKTMANLLFGIVAGHGERPGRVVATAVGTVLTFAGLFRVLWPEQGAPYGTPIGFLMFSLESFITLVLGGSEPVGDTLVRLFAQIEAFIGAFLIALFVFALTRSVHR